MNKEIKKCTDCGCNIGKRKWAQCFKCEEKELKNHFIEAYGEAYADERMQEIFFNRMISGFRSRTRTAFKRIRESKPTKTEELLGCSWQEAKIHMESYLSCTLNFLFV